MHPGHTIDGPAIIAESNATTVVEPGWRVRVTDLEHLVLERAQPRHTHTGIGTTVDPVMLEVFNNLFMNTAKQMRVQLRRTAYSVNIKERLDFSRALFDADGNLIANAPHIAVHLGSMSESIKTVIARNAGQMQRGDVFMLNDPSQGGTHLPDVTVLTPVYDERSAVILFYVGSRGHHADIGGNTPGSMPPFSTHIDEEGVRIDNFRLVAGGRLRDRELLEVPRAGPYPSCNPSRNIADLQAQIAVNEKGMQELRKLVAQFGLRVVQAYMGHVQYNAEESGKQLQRADRGVHGRGAVRFPHTSRGRHSTQRRLPEAAEGDHSRRLDVEPSTARGGRRRQRRNLHLHHQCAVRRVRRDGGGPVRDE